MFKSERLYDRMVELRRRFHREPELAFEETKTAASVMAELRRLDIPFEYGGQGGGVVARLDVGAQARTVALRAEMDALPGQETTGLPFTSTNPGAVHACGHDAHMAMLLGAAALLKESAPAGNVLLVFQPAEERGGGSRVVLKSGALDGVRAIFGGHVTHHYRTGEIMVAPGVITAQSDRFRIVVRGRGGHAARPHESVDAVVIAGVLITALQTLVSRETNPVHPSVVTIGRVQAGTAANMIAAEAVLEGSIRTTHREGRLELHSGLRRMARAVGELHRAVVDVEISEGYPPVVNASHEADLAARAARTVVGDGGVVPQDHPSMGSEDFSYYLSALPGCYVRFGARAAGREYVPLHSPAFDVDESVLMVGADYFDAVARTALDEYSRE